MSKLFSNRRSVGNLADQAALSSLLDPNQDDSLDSCATNMPPTRQLRGRAKSSLIDYQSRTWLSAAAENQGSRQPTRKLVKDLNGSRPSTSLELSDSEIPKDKGMLRRSLAKLKSLYRRDRDRDRDK
ncbi:hypothetical protein QBC38DRAFT_90684 [Podospora fimiseda]|uniref:Uncharacterized protein n=1 Tax=Podospora fimiseda TaxID=252190 RepID=A0AAN7BYZ5_9PEZI|nr:hypothetical protein QBC38DRAFT_90684 [Podospora fimiseda]